MSASLPHTRGKYRIPQKKSKIHILKDYLCRQAGRQAGGRQRKSETPCHLRYKAKSKTYVHPWAGWRCRQKAFSYSYFSSSSFALGKEFIRHHDLIKNRKRAKNPPQNTHRRQWRDGGGCQTKLYMLYMCLFRRRRQHTANTVNRLMW